MTVNPSCLTRDRYQQLDGLEENAVEIQQSLGLSDDFESVNYRLAQTATRGPTADGTTSALGFCEQFSSGDHVQQCRDSPAMQEISSQTYGTNPEVARSFEQRMDFELLTAISDLSAREEGNHLSAPIIPVNYHSQNLQETTSPTYLPPERTEANATDVPEIGDSPSGSVISQLSSKDLVASFTSNDSPSTSHSSEDSLLKPYRCQSTRCTASFKSSSQLSRHNQVRHGVSSKNGSLFCSISNCPFRHPHGKTFVGFRRRDHWRKHMRCVHHCSDDVDFGDPVDSRGNSVLCRQRQR